jgi:SAM-dependent methyltransferase
LTADRLQHGTHVELLGSTLELRAPRVLEIRTRAGSLGASLTRLYGGEACAMTLFENQRFVIEQVYGIATSPLVDFDQFTIPYQQPFDLIVANHMLTHAIRPREFLDEVRRHLRPGGHLYLYNEPGDAEYLTEGKSMFNTLNAFHLQAFDGAALARSLQSNGFVVTFQTRYDGSHLCLARVESGASALVPIGTKQLERRRRAHLRARDAAILMVPPHARSRVAAEWSDAADRACALGIEEVREDGQLRVRRQSKDA